MKTHSSAGMNRMTGVRDLGKRAAGLAFALGFLIPGTALAQTRLIPQIGVYSNVAEPGKVQGPSGAYDIGRHESATAYGLGIEFASRESVSFRIGGLYVPDAGAAAGECASLCDGPDLFSAVGTLVVRPLGKVLFLEPYVVGGAGAQRFQFGDEGLGNQIANVVDDGSVWIGVLGVGAEVDLGGPTVLLELVDHFHKARVRLPGQDRDRIDDFYFTVGLSLGH